MRYRIFSLTAALALAAFHGTGQGQATASKRTARVKIEMSVQGEAVPSSFIAALENTRGSLAGGTGVFRLDDRGFFYRITVNDLSGVVTQAHLHGEATGEVLRAIAFEGNMAAGTWKADEAAQPLTPALRQALQAERIYVDVHTAANPGGELRGQVAPASGLGGLEVAFSRSAAKSRLNYAWKGFTDDRGEVEIDITEEGRRRQGAGGYYRVRLSNPLTKRVVGEWHSIPVQGGRTITLRIPVGGVPALAHPVFGVPLQPAARSVAAAPQSRIPAVALFQNYPNPFNTATQIRYELPQAGLVRLRVYDLLGQEVARLVDEPQAAGSYTVTWDARDRSSGLYYYLLEAGVSRTVRKLVLIK